MKIAQVGAGSMGMIAGALISKAGYDITLIDANKQHVDAMNKSGAKIIGKLNEVIPVKAATPDNLSGQYDLVILQTKQMHMASALESLKPHMHDNTIVLALQNGIPEDKIAEIIGRERVLGGSVGWGATWIEPGVCELTSDVSSMTTTIGELDGKITDRILKVKEILSNTGTIEVETNLMGIKWTKLIMNATWSGMSTVCGCTFGEVMNNPLSWVCLAYIGQEGANVIKAQGITAANYHGFHPLVEKVSFSSKAELQALYDNVYNKFVIPHYKLKASMLQDLEKGRQCEINEINGKIVEIGKKENVPTPFNSTVVDIVTKIQDGKLKPGFNNLQFFNIPDLK